MALEPRVIRTQPIGPIEVTPRSISTVAARYVGNEITLIAGTTEAAFVVWGSTDFTIGVGALQNANQHIMFPSDGVYQIILGAYCEILDRDPGTEYIQLDIFDYNDTFLEELADTQVIFSNGRLNATATLEKQAGDYLLARTRLRIQGLVAGDSIRISPVCSIAKVN